jgi:pilin isopeptide linkage protein
MIKKKINRSKLNTAGRSTVIWALSVMLVCAFTCLVICRYVLNGTRTVSAEGAYKPLRVEIPFECLGDTKLSQSKYVINIAGTEDEYPQPEKSSIELKDGEGSFFVTFTEPGDYTYRVYQEKGDNEETLYDDTAYEIHISVMNKGWDSGESQQSIDEKAELIYYMSVNYVGNNEKPSVIMFANKPVKEGTTEKTTEKTTGKTTESSTEKTTGKTTESSTEKTEKTTEKKSEAVTESTTKDMTPKTENTTIDSVEKLTEITTTEIINDSTTKTGDDTRIGLALMIMAVSAAAVFVIIILKKNADKKRKED